MSYAQGQATVKPKPVSAPAATTPLVKKGARRKVSDLKLQTGTVKKYGPQDGRMADMAKPTWSRIADYCGVNFEILAAFNPELAMTPIAEAATDQTPYVPSAQEVLLWQTLSAESPSVTAASVRDNASSAASASPQGLAKYKQLEATGRTKVVASARDRQAGETGDAYAQVSEAFYTPNPNLAAGKAAQVDGKTDRVAAWGASWKCNVFVNDSLSQAGLKTPMLDNKHYATAGMLYENHTDKAGAKPGTGKTFEEVGYANCRPGDIFVRYGGTGEASSHTEVVTAKLPDASFYASGAHDIGTYERHYFTSQETYDKAIDGLIVAHLKAQGRETTPEAVQAERYGLGWQLADAAHLRQMNPDDYRFLRHKQVGKVG